MTTPTSGRFAVITPPGALPVLPSRRILIVDDEASIRDAIARFLRARSFEVHLADTVTMALERLRTTRFAGLVCDVRMPGSSGMDLVPAALRIDEDLAVLMLTGIDDAATATEALAHGAMDYLLKPIELDRLEHAIERALQRRQARIDQRSRELDQCSQSAVSTAALQTIVTLIEAKDPYRAGHAQRVAALGAAMADTLSLGPDFAAEVRLAAELHDIGNVALPEAMLLKPSVWTPGEHEAVRQHVRIGVQILAPLKHLAPVLPFVRDHHERWDGRGYPAGLHGDAISIGGRMLAVADAYVAVTSGRPYATPLPPGDALDHLSREAGAHFDPSIFAALQKVIRAQLA